MPKTIKIVNIDPTAAYTPPERITTRKIGNTTFLVSSRFKGGKEGDIVSTFSRLIQYDADKPDKA